MRLKTNQHLIQAVKVRNLNTVESLLKGNRIIAKVDPNIPDTNGLTALHHAVLGMHFDNTCSIIRILLDSGANIDLKDHKGFTPSDYFINKSLLQHLSIDKEEDVKTIVRLGLDINATDSNEKTALHYQIGPYMTFQKIKFLILNGANPNIVVNKDGLTLLQYLITKDYGSQDIEFLLKYGANPNLGNKQGHTALHYSITHQKNHNNLMKLLLRYGANPNLADEDGNTSLHYLVKDENYDSHNLITLLSHGANPNLCNKNGHTALHYAIRYERYERIFRTTPSDDVTPHRGNDLKIKPPTKQLCLGDEFNAAKDLLAHGADPGLCNNEGDNSIFYVIKEHSKLNSFINEATRTIGRERKEDELYSNLMQLIQHSPLIPKASTSSGPHKELGLYYPYSDKRRGIINDYITKVKDVQLSSLFEFIQQLLKRNLDINARDNNGCTILHIAAQLNVDIGIIRLLVTNGANINLPDNQGQTPIFYTIKENVFWGGFHKGRGSFHEGIVEYFLNYENQSKAENLYSLKRSSSNYSHSFNKTLHVKDAAGKSLLNKAIELENERIIYSLIDGYGIDPFAKDDQKKSPEDYIKEKILNYVKEQDQSYEKQKSIAFNDKINTYKKLLNHIQTNCRRSYPNQIKYPVPSPSPSEQKRPVAAPSSIIATVNTTSTTSQKATEITKDNKVTSPQLVTQIPSKSTTPPVTASTPATPAPKELALKIDEKVLSEIKPKIDQLIQEQLVAQSAVLFKNFSSSLKQIQEKYRVDANQMNVANSNLSEELKEKIQGEMLAEFTKIVIPQMQSDLQRLMQDQVYLDQVQKMQECFMNAIHKRHTSLTSEVAVLSHKVDPLHKEYTAKESVKAQQKALLEQPVIGAFYKELEIQLSSRFSCQMLLISKVFQETKSNVQKGGELAVDIFTKFLETIPGFSLITFLANFALKEGVIKLTNDIKERKHANVMDHFQLTEDAPIQAEAIARAIALQYQERGALTHANKQQASLAGKRAAEKLYEYIAQGYLSPQLSEAEKLQQLQHAVAPDKILKGILPPEHYQQLHSRQQNYKLAIESQKQQQFIGLQQKNEQLEKTVASLTTEKSSLEHKVGSMEQDMLELKLQLASLVSAYKSSTQPTPAVVGEWTSAEARRTDHQQFAAPEK